VCTAADHSERALAHVHAAQPAQQHAAAATDSRNVNMGGSGPEAEAGGQIIVGQMSEVIVRARRKCLR